MPLAHEPGDGIGAAELADEGHGEDQHERHQARPAADRADVGAQARVGEEDRQEKHPDDRRDAAFPFLDEAPVAVQRHADHESADDREDPEVAGDRGGDEQHDNDVGNERQPHPAVAREMVRDGAAERLLEDEEDERQVRDQTGDPRDRPAPAERALHEQRDRSQNDPSRDIADGRGADRERRRPRVRETELHEDAAEDGDRRDRHGDREEEREAEQWHGLRQSRMEPRRGEIAHREGDRESDRADEDDRSAMAGQMPLELELQPDLEHQEDQSDLGQTGEDRAGRGGKELVHEAREKGAEQARSQQETGQDLAGHVGLAEPAHDRGHEPGREEDHDELIEQAEGDLSAPLPTADSEPAGVSGATTVEPSTTA